MLNLKELGEIFEAVAYKYYGEDMTIKSFSYLRIFHIKENVYKEVYNLLHYYIKGKGTEHLMKKVDDIIVLEKFNNILIKMNGFQNIKPRYGLIYEADRFIIETEEKGHNEILFNCVISFSQDTSNRLITLTKVMQNYLKYADLYNL